VTDAVAASPPLPAPRRRGGGRIVVWLFALALLAVLGWRGRLAWQAHQAQVAAAARDQAGQWHALDARIDALRRDQRAQAQRITQADAGNRVLRDEVLGLGQRVALLQDSVDKLADPARRGVQALRLDEAELLLALGEQRLQLAGDLDGARRAYALADGVLAGIDDPAWLDLRQALAQERAALDALGVDPKSLALARLDAFSTALAPPPALPEDARDTTLPWWRRAVARIVQVRPSNREIAVAPGDRAAGYAALQLELTLARGAGERRDADAWRRALARADGWLSRLWPPSPALQRQRAQLRAVQSLPLQLALPTLGSTLQQLRSMRTAR
jgi:uroporphyrin-3 C-methyltransferase